MKKDKGKDVPVKSMMGIDRLVHEPARLTIMAHLYAVDSADLLFLIRQTGLTWGNLSVHVSKLENAGYLLVRKEFLGKKPHTIVNLTPQGRKALEVYRKNMKAMLNDL